MSAIESLADLLMNEQVLVGLFTLAGVAAGGWITSITERRTWRRSQALSARLLLAKTFPFLWRSGSWGDFQVHIAQLRAYLSSAGTDPELAQAVYAVVEECWRQIDLSIARGTVDPEFGPGVPTELLVRYHEAIRTISDELNDRGWTSWRTRLASRKRFRGLPK